MLKLVVNAIWYVEGKSDTPDVPDLPEEFHSSYKPMKDMNKNQSHKQDGRTRFMARDKRSCANARYIPCITKNSG
jgi:hypothetical protein